MDWDGIGTAAMFMASGGFGVAVVMLRAYQAKLSSKLESERIRRSSTGTDEALVEQIRDLESQVNRLTERVDFTERLIGKGKPGSATTPTPDA
jgi:hypothetical protein